MLILAAIRYSDATIVYSRGQRGNCPPTGYLEIIYKLTDSFLSLQTSSVAFLRSVSTRDVTRREDNVYLLVEADYRSLIFVVVGTWGGLA